MCKDFHSDCAFSQIPQSFNLTVFQYIILKMWRQYLHQMQDSNWLMTAYLGNLMDLEILNTSAQFDQACSV
jgi:hypothetical protein